MTATHGDHDVEPTEPDTSPASTNWLMIGVAATCLLVGFLAGLRTGTASENRDDREGASAPATAGPPSEEAEGKHARPEGTLRLGESFLQFDGRSTTAALFADPLPSDAKHTSRASTRWVGLLVGTCADADMARKNAFSASALDWELVDADGDRFRPQRARSGLHRSMLYPSRSVAVYPGECIQGWVLWALPDGSTATTAVFSPTPTWFHPQNHGTVTWALAGTGTRSR
jgi:hypothetical protein